MRFQRKNATKRFGGTTVAGRLKWKISEIMSNRTPSRNLAVGRRRGAIVFAALGDATRLRLLERLGARDSLSITQLTIDLPVTRQAVTKHLRVLERAKLVTEEHCGRERKFRVAPAAIGEAQATLQAISQQWDNALGRLKSHVESRQST